MNRDSDYPGSGCPSRGDPDFGRTLLERSLPRCCAVSFPLVNTHGRCPACESGVRIGETIRDCRIPQLPVRCGGDRGRDSPGDRQDDRVSRQVDGAVRRRAGCRESDRLS